MSKLTREQAIKLIKRKKLSMVEAHMQEFELLDSLLDYIESSEDLRADMNAYFDDSVEITENEQGRKGG